MYFYMGLLNSDFSLLKLSFLTVVHIQRAKISICYKEILQKKKIKQNGTFFHHFSL